MALLYKGHASAVFMVAWSPDDTSIVSAIAGGTAQVWLPQL